MKKILSALAMVLFSTGSFGQTLNVIGSTSTPTTSWTPVLNNWTVVGSAPPISGNYTVNGSLVCLNISISAGTAGNTTVASTFLTSTITGIPFPVNGSSGLSGSYGTSGNGAGSAVMNGSTIYPATQSAIGSTFVYSGCYNK